MRKIISILIVLLGVATAATGQSRKEWIEFGDQAYELGNYKLALSCYQHAVKLAPGADRDLVAPYDCRPYTPPKKTADSVAIKNALNDSNQVAQDSGKVAPELVEGNDPKTVYVVHRIAECYRLLHDYDNAELWYTQAVAKPDERFPDATYFYGVTLQNNAQYDSAIVQFEKYQVGKDPESTEYRRATRNIGGCLNSMDTSRVKKEVIVTKLDSNINAGTATFAAGFYGDPEVLLYTCAKQGNASTEERQKQGLDQYSTDIFISRKMNGQWMKGQPLSSQVGALNTTENDGAASVSFGREHLFFTRWNEDGTESSIYMCRNVGDSWLAPQKLNANVNVPGTKAMMPFLSNDGSTLYFVSNRPGGQGGLDIWKCQLDEEGNPGEAVNMGPVINSAEDEITPFYHFTSSTLFYSSNGFSGYGGFDIVKSSYNADDNTWASPRNLDAPYNSSRDDAYFTMDRTQQMGYFSSDREKCMECGPGSGYCYKAYSWSNRPLQFSIHGVVYDANTNEPISNALLTFKDVRGDNEPFYIITDSIGYYESELTLGHELYIKAQKNKYFGDATNVSTVGLTDDSVFVHDFYLTPIPAGEITIPGIEYDFDKATLRPESMKILDDLAAFLVLNDNLSVEIASHTDARGSDAYNLRLSQARAKSCVDYLISKGIAADRLVATGYGETKPLISEADINKMPTEEEKEAAHQKNRRTSFRPIKEGVIMDKWEGKDPNK